MLNPMRLSGRHRFLWLLLPLAGYFALAKQVSWRPRTLGQWDATMVGPSPLAYSSDGRWLASGGKSSLTLWDLYSNEPFTVPGAPYPSALAFSPDGRTLAVKGYVWEPYNTVLCDVQTHPVRLRLGSKHYPHRMCFAPDGRTLAVGTVTGLVQLWDCQSGALKRTIVASHTTKPQPSGQMGLAGPTSAVSVVFIGNSLLTGDDQGLIKVWNIETGHLKRSWRALKGGVRGLATSPDGRMLASGHSSGVVQLWSMPSAHLLRSLASGGEMGSMSFFTDSKTFAAVSGYGQVMLWNIDTGELQRTLNANAFFLALAPDGTTLATCGIAPPPSSHGPFVQTALQFQEQYAGVLLWRIQ